MADNGIEKLVKGIKNKNRRALARLITLVESRHPGLAQAMGDLYNLTGQANIIGITGPPGAGKSTLTDKLITGFREQDKSVGVVAIDPSSPFSGGALLGDRVRMMQHASDKEVFIRSMGSRGSYGGLSRATREITGLMDAFGFDVIIVETVGVGQTELDVMDLADTVVVTFVPESGDVVQTMKAGLTEIADIFIVNKADRDGADYMVRELEQMVEYNPDPEWPIPVLKTVAVKNEGVERLIETLQAHRNYREKSKQDPGALERLRINRFADIFAGLLSDTLIDGEGLNGEMKNLLQEVRKGIINPYAAAQKIMEDPELISKLADPDKDES